MGLVGGMNGVSDASGTKYETPGPADGSTATVRRPAFVTRGETSEPGSFSLLDGATTAAVASAHVWNGAVNGDSARTRNTNAHRFLSMPTVNIVAGNATIDLLARRRLSRVSLWGGFVVLVSLPLRFAVAHTAAWLAIASWLIR